MNEMMVSKLEAKKVTMEGLTWGNGETMRHKDLLCMDNSYTSYSTEQKMDLLKTVLKNIAMAAHEVVYCIEGEIVKCLLAGTTTMGCGDIGENGNGCEKWKRTAWDGESVDGYIATFGCSIGTT